MFITNSITGGTSTATVPMAQITLTSNGEAEAGRVEFYLHGSRNFEQVVISGTAVFALSRIDDASDAVAQQDTWVSVDPFGVGCMVVGSLAQHTLTLSLEVSGDIDGMAINLGMQVTPYLGHAVSAAT